MWGAEERFGGGHTPPNPGEGEFVDRICPAKLSALSGGGWEPFPGTVNINSTRPVRPALLGYKLML